MNTLLTRLRNWLTDLRFAVPVITTRGRLLDRLDNANLDGHKEGREYAETHGEDYTAGYAAGWTKALAVREDAQPTVPAPRASTRQTRTGNILGVVAS
jgi:hypothetical protein